MVNDGWLFLILQFLQHDVLVVAVRVGSATIGFARIGFARIGVARVSLSVVRSAGGIAAGGVAGTAAIVTGTIACIGSLGVDALNLALLSEPVRCRRSSRARR